MRGELAQRVHALTRRLESRDPALAARFASAHVRSREEFTFVFPETFDYYYKNFDPLPIQLQIYLVEEGLPYTPVASISEYYAALRDHRYGRRICFDLSKTGYVGESALVMLDSLGGFLRGITGHRTRIMLSGGMVPFLSKVGFLSVSRDWGDESAHAESVGRPPQTHESKALIPMSRIAGIDDVANMASLVVNDMGLVKFLEREYGMDNDLVRDFCADVVSEICQNVTEHSQGRGSILVRARHPTVFGQTTANIELAISDSGIGIRESLMTKYPSVYRRRTHIDAIRDVLRGEFPHPADESRGGILRAHEYVERFPGLIFLHSICAKGSNRDATSHDNDASWRFLPGTHVSILIPRHRVHTRGGGAG